MFSFRSCFLALCCLCLSYGIHGQVISIELDTTSLKTIAGVTIEGNEVTKRKIITRELTLAAGDTLAWSDMTASMEQSQKNLMNTGLFNFVEMERIQIDNSQVIIHIKVQERWYTFPFPIFELAETNFNVWWDKRDFSRTNYGLYLVRENFRGLNEKLAFTARFGYNKKFAVDYFTPNLNRAQTLGLSFSFNYHENDEIVYNTLGNERAFYNNDDGNAREFYEVKSGLTYRGNIFTRHTFEVKLSRVDVRDTVVTLNDNYLSSTGARMEYATLSYSFSHDKRDYQPYPLQGYQVYGTLEQHGLGLTNRNDGLGIFTTLAGWRHHIPLSNRFYTAYSLRGKNIWTNDIPYYFITGLGYDSFVRGYEFYVIDGTQYGLGKANLKFEILKPKKVNVPLVPTDKLSKSFISLYLNLFADAGYVSGGGFEQQNTLADRWLHGYGIGLDLVTYYDLVIRLESTWNHLGEQGFYLHFKQPL